MARLYSVALLCFLTRCAALDSAAAVVAAGGAAVLTDLWPAVGQVYFLVEHKCN